MKTSHTFEIVYKELRIPLTALQVSIKKLAETEPVMAARLNENDIFTPYQARQFLEKFRQGNGEVKAEQKTLKGIILQQAKQIETIQHGLNSSICAFTGIDYNFKK